MASMAEGLIEKRFSSRTRRVCTESKRGKVVVIVESSVRYLCLNPILYPKP